MLKVRIVYPVMVENLQTVEEKLNKYWGWDIGFYPKETSNPKELILCYMNKNQFDL